MTAPLRTSVFHIVTSAQVPLPGLHEQWPGDPGARQTDRPPFSLCRGDKFVFGEAYATFDKRARNGEFIFQVDDAGIPIIRSAFRLLQEYACGFLRRQSDKGDLSPARKRAQEADASFVEEHASSHFKSSVERYGTYVRAVLEEDRARASRGLGHLPRSGSRTAGERDEAHVPPRNIGELIEAVAKTIGDSEPPHWKTLRTKLAQAEVSNGRLSSPVKLGDGRSIREMPLRLDPKVEAIIDEIFDAELLVGNGASAFRLKGKIDKKIIEINKTLPVEEHLGKPAQNTIVRRILMLEGVELLARTSGSGKARLVYAVTGKNPLPTDPLEYVMFDYKLMDIELTTRELGPDGETRLKRVGRPYLAAYLDIATGSLAGWYFSFRQPSKATFLASFRQAVLPKSIDIGVLSDHRDYPVFGLPHVLVTDREKALVSDETEAALLDMGVSIRRPGIRAPRKKGNIESLFNFIDQSFSSQLPGYVGKDRLNKPDREWTDESLLDVDEFIRRFDKWVVWHFGHCARTRSMSPFRAWNDFEKRHPGWAPDLPASMEKLDSALTLRFVCTVSEAGVGFKKLFYNSEWLRTIRSDVHAHKTGNPKVKVYLRPHDLTAVWVEHPFTGERRLVQSLQPRYTAEIDWFQHETVLAAGAAVKLANWLADEDVLIELLNSITAKAQQKFKKEKTTGVGDATAFLRAQIGSPGAYGRGAEGIGPTDHLRKSSKLADAALQREVTDRSLERVAPAVSEQGASRSQRLAAARRILTEGSTARERASQ